MMRPDFGRFGDGFGGVLHRKWDEHGGFLS